MVLVYLDIIYWEKVRHIALEIKAFYTIYKLSKVSFQKEYVPKKPVQEVGINSGATSSGPTVCPRHTTVSHIHMVQFGPMLVTFPSDWIWRASIISGKQLQWMSPLWSWPFCSYYHSSHASKGLCELSQHSAASLLLCFHQLLDEVFMVTYMIFINLTTG